MLPRSGAPEQHVLGTTLDKNNIHCTFATSQCFKYHMSNGNAKSHWGYPVDMAFAYGTGITG